ncbi:MAG: hypothetical protein J6Y86_08180 [Pseudobutyrivibrio sp.]|nr:hypothetical protein [Pseudobutyrivibrio sp.]
MAFYRCGSSGGSPLKLTNCTFNVQTSSPVSYYGTVLDCGYQSGIIGKENVAITGSQGDFCHMYDTGPNVSSGYGRFDITIDPSTGLVKLISRSSSWGWLLNYPSVVDLVIW